MIDEDKLMVREAELEAAYSPLELLSQKTDQRLQPLWDLVNRNFDQTFNEEDGFQLADAVDQQSRLLYVQRATILIEESSKLLDRLEGDLDELEEQFRVAHHIEWWDARGRLDKLNAESGLRRILSIIKTKKVQKQFDSVDARVETLQSSIDSKKTQIRELQNQVSRLKVKRAEYFSQEVNDAVSETVSGYSEFLNSLLSSTELAESLQEDLIQEKIEPWLDSLSDTTQLSVEKRTTILESIRFYLRNLYLPNGEPQTYLLLVERELRELSAELPAQFRGIVELIRRSSTFEHVLCEVISRTATRNLSPLVKAARKYMYQGIATPPDIAGEIERAINSGLADSTFSASKLLKDHFAEKMRLSYEYKPMGFTEVQLWSRLKEMDSAKSIFGAEMVRQDEEQYSYMLENAITDSNGHIVDLLTYYPTAESIRNLLLLAAAGGSSYRTAHANRALQNLAKQPDWSTQVDELILVYPEFSQEVHLLKDWNLGGDTRYEVARLICGSYTRSVIESVNPDEKLLQLSYDAIPNSEAIEVLIQRNVLSIEESDKLRKARSILVDVERELFEARQRLPETKHVQSVFFKRMLDHLLVSLLKSSPDEIDEELLALKLSYLNYAEKIIENAQDYDALSYLSDSIVSTHSKLILSSPDILSHFTKIREICLFEIDLATDQRVGREVGIAARNREVSVSEYVKDISNYELKRIDEVLSSEDAEQVGSLSNIQLLIAYIRLNSENMMLRSLSEGAVSKIKTMVEESRIADDVYLELIKIWNNYLNGDHASPPFSLIFFCEFIEACDGAGPLTQLQTFSKAVITHIRAMNSEIPEDCKVTTANGLQTVEGRFQSERWSNDARTDFYSISQEIQAIDPILFSEFFEVINHLSSTELKFFVQNVFPLFRTWLVMIEQRIEPSSRPTYDGLIIEQIVKEIRNCANQVKQGTFNASEKRTEILHYIRALFKQRFGILSVPEDFSIEGARSLSNVATYLTNLNDRTPKREAILAYYLALMLNNHWQDFRSGKSFPPEQLLTSEMVAQLQEFKDTLGDRIQLFDVGRLGIDASELDDFVITLQAEVSTITIGNIETIDAKLSNIVLNIQELEDLDFYTNALDKQRMRLLLSWGKKRIGSVVARLYQSLPPISKSISFSDEDAEIIGEIKKLLIDSGMEVSQATVKEVFQDGMKPFNSVLSIIEIVSDFEVERELEKMQSLMKPPSVVVNVFQRLGESFTLQSGASAYYPDLQYLENLIVKNEDQITNDEKSVVVDYIDAIREQLLKLDQIHQTMKRRLSGVILSESSLENQQLVEKMQEIFATLETKTEAQPIISTVTNNLNLVIENMRACLSATKNGSNNDTNLTFGDPTKFYVFSQTEMRKTGSIADEVVFFAPITYEGGNGGGQHSEYAFVLDQIYGTHTTAVLNGHLRSLSNKVTAIKSKFPLAKISIFVPASTLKSSGTSEDSFETLLIENNLLGFQVEANVDIAESAAGDHYIEFGGESARRAGKRQANGYIIMV